MNEYSLLSYWNIDALHKNKCYQKIVAVLSIRPMTRETIAKETHLPENTVRPRICELMKVGIIDVCGEGHTSTGAKCEVLGLTI